MDVRGCEPGPAALGGGPGGGGGEARVLGRTGAATALPATSPRPRLLTPRPHLTEVSSGGPRALEDSVLSRGQGCSWGSGDHGAGGRHGYQRCLAGAGAGRGDGPGPAHLRGFSRPDPAPCPGFREPPLPIGTMPQGQGCPWRRLSGRTRTGLGSHPLTGCPPRSIVYLEIDNRQCVQSSSQCFQSATDVAAFLGALASLGSLNIPYKIEAVQSEWPACCPSHSPSGRVAWVGRGPLRGAASQPPPPLFWGLLPPTGACHAVQGLGSAFLAFSAWHAPPPIVPAVSEAGPGEQAHPPESGSPCLSPPLPPDFSLLGIISKSLQRFFKERERESAEN